MSIKDPQVQAMVDCINASNEILKDVSIFDKIDIDSDEFNKMIRSSLPDVMWKPIRPRNWTPKQEAAYRLKRERTERRGTQRAIRLFNKFYNDPKFKRELMQMYLDMVSGRYDYSEAYSFSDWFKRFEQRGDK